MASISLRVLGVAALLLAPLGVWAQTVPGSMPAPTLPDVKVRTQAGEEVRFADLLAGRTVAINFIFTSCTSVCPLMGASFGRVQALLGDRASGITLISVSIDPETDTPARLAEWSRRFNAKPGWTLVTGTKTDIDRLLKALGVFTAEASSHSPAAIIADDSRGIWRKVDGLAPPSTIVAVIDSVAASRTQRSTR